MSSYLAYLLMYTLRAYSPAFASGVLEPEHQPVFDGLKAENRDYFVRCLGPSEERGAWLDAVKTRRATLEAMGSVVKISFTFSWFHTYLGFAVALPRHGDRCQKTDFPVLMAPGMLLHLLDHSPTFI